MSSVMLDQIIVGGATSLANLIIHAVLLAAVVRTVRRLSVRDSVVPAFLQYTVVIVATGTLLVAGHFSEVVLWAFTYGLVGAAPRQRPRLFCFRQLHHPRLRRNSARRTMAPARADDGAERHHADRLVDGAHHRGFAPHRACAEPEAEVRGRTCEPGSLAQFPG